MCLLVIIAKFILFAGSRICSLKLLTAWPSITASLASVLNQQLIADLRLKSTNVTNQILFVEVTATNHNSFTFRINFIIYNYVDDKYETIFVK